ncbi:MAG TPA: glycoside hydrolase family 6 protein [Candidatus Limnocylindrales bacterium]|nr:glycoside hydrolase family 6 protein [Candidatus Limnocylindrales bacterium]
MKYLRRLINDMKAYFGATEYQGQKRREMRIRRLSGAALGAVLVAGLAVAISGGRNNGSSLTDSLPFVSKQSATTSPLSDKKLYVDPDSNAARQAEIWRRERPDKAVFMDKLADQQNARWYTNGANYDDMYSYVQAANAEGAVPVIVAYYIPKRDCNKYSSGGAPNEAAYYDYIDTFVKAIAQQQAIVVIEPDALVHTISNDGTGKPCLTESERGQYYTMLSYAVERLKSLPSTYVYLDAGNSGWTKDTDVMADRLKKANIAMADGFSLNVSNFRRNDETIKFGRAISEKIDDKHFIIDTSRNGLGPYENHEQPGFNWCNPPGRALGHYPTGSTGEPYVDAYLHIKNIGESDGSDPDPKKCFNGPPAGTWWPEYALELVERWPEELQYSFQRR